METAGLVHAEDRMLVGVEGDRLAVSLKVALGGAEVGEGRLRLDELGLTSRFVR